MTTREAGWYEDPQDGNLLRYWDGVSWTEHTSPRQKPGLDQAGTGSTGQVGPYAGQQGGQQGDAGGGQYGASQGQYGSPQGQSGQYGSPAGAPGQYGGPPGQQPPAYGQAPQYGAPQYGPPQQSGYGQQGAWGQAMPGAGSLGTMTGPTTPDGQPLASWGMRLLARIIDGILTAIVFGTIALVVLAPDLSSQFQDWFTEMTEAMESGAQPATTLPADLSASMLRASLGLGVLCIIYEAVMLKFFGATVGKLATGLRVRLREQPGPLSWGTSGIRAVVWQGPSLLSGIQGISFLSSLFGLLNGLWPLWDNHKQSLNDKIAKTNVVKK